MNADAERLYRLLPELYRARDEELGGPLRRLVGALALTERALRADIEALYDNWFIETCAAWVVPYLADLVDPARAPGAPGQRALTANALAYRRRKGTRGMLQRLAQDATGWPARVVEFLPQVARTQHLNHLRPEVARLDLRADLGRLGGAFDPGARGADVRGGGRAGLDLLGVFLWPLRSHAVEGAAARRLPDTRPDGRPTFAFDPLGRQVALHHRPRPLPAEEDPFAGRCDEEHVPHPLRGRALAADLALPPARRRYLGEDPVLSVRLRWPDRQEDIPPEALCFVGAPPAPRGARVAVDPARGRLLLLDPRDAAAEVIVSYAYAAAADLGGGPYQRLDSLLCGLVTAPDEAPLWEAGVSRDRPAPCASLGEAVSAWNAAAREAAAAHKALRGVIALLDSGTYAEDLIGERRLFLPRGGRLLIVAARCPPSAPGDPLLPRLSPCGVRPHLRGTLEVEAEGGELALEGLLIEGDLRVLPGRLAALRLHHTTLTRTLRCEGPSLDLVAQADRSRCGEIVLDRSVPGLQIRDSLIDGRVDAPGAAVRVQRATLLRGPLDARRLDADDALLCGEVQVSHRQEGCVRFSYLPPNAVAPRRYRCQPDLGCGPGSAPPELRPAFASLRPGDPGYGCLADTCPPEIRRGAEDGGEMGAFHHLRRAQRLDSLRAGLDEHLQLGLRAEVFLVR